MLEDDFPPDTDDDCTDPDLAEARQIAIDIESECFGKGKGNGKGKGKRKSKKTEKTLEIVKTCRCICPMQHFLLEQEYKNSILIEKKIKLEILKLEKELSA